MDRTPLEGAAIGHWLPSLPGFFRDLDTCISGSVSGVA